MESKRTKTGVEGTRHSKILQPFRTVGIVTNGVPLAVSTLGQTYIVSTVVGRSIQIYDAASLRLLFMTQPQAPSDIECVCTHFHHVFAVASGELLIYRRGQLVAQQTISKVGKRQRATKIVIFGGYICICVPRSGSSDAGVHVFRWQNENAEFYTTLQTPKILGNIVDIVHLPAYVNKLMVATESCLVLFNVKSGKLLHTFSEIAEGIKLVEAAPTALDKVAVVCANGDVVLLDVRRDKEMFRLTTNEPITALSFRSDVGTESAALLGLGTANGDVFFYSLDLRRRIQSFRSFSTSAIASVSFLPGQAIVLISGAENRLLELVFDPVVASNSTSQAVQQRARLLRQRGGHALPSSALLFADEEAHFLLSSSQDGSLWAFSLRKDSQSHAFGGLQKVHDMSAITAMAYAQEKSDRWATLVTAHKGSSEARTWSVPRGALGSLVLPTVDGKLVTAVEVSTCGNFGVVGSAGGAIGVYNLQSGLLRMSLDKAHDGAITGMAVLPNNSAIISCSLDGTINFHEFVSMGSRSPAKLASIDLHLGAINDLRFHAGSGLVCVSTDSMALVVVDSKTYKVVRELWGHGNRITSFDFVPSGRWILSASLDQTIRTWDVPTGAWIDGVRVSNVVTNLRVSPNSEWVATSHVRGVGVQMWSLQTLSSHAFRSITEEDVVDIDMPTVSGETGVSLLEGLLGNSEAESESESHFEVEVDQQSTQLQDGLITLSGKPANKFTTLIHLDAIRERNKPEVAPQKPEKQPFFLGLPTDANGETERNGNLPRITTGEVSEVEGQFTSPFTHLLAVGEFEKLAEHLSDLGPAATDLEIRSIEGDAPHSEIISFIDAMSEQLRAGKRFELVQAWMAMLLDSHADVFAEPVTDKLRESFENWLSVQKDKVDEMQEATRFCSGVLAFLRQ